MARPELTREQLTAILEDGRWHPVSTGAALHFVHQPCYELELHYLMTRWQPAVPEAIGCVANMRYRLRLRPEFLRRPWASSTQG